MAIVKPGDGRSRLQAIVSTENHRWLGHIAVDFDRDKSVLLDCLLTAIRTNRLDLLDGDLSRVLTLAQTASGSENG